MKGAYHSRDAKQICPNPECNIVTSDLQRHLRRDRCRHQHFHMRTEKVKEDTPQWKKDLFDKLIRKILSHKKKEKVNA